MKKSILIFMTVIMILSSLTVGANAASKVTMYAPDGRTTTVYDYQVDSYKSVGWFTSPAMTVYAPDGRTMAIKKSQLEAYQNVGWYAYPVTVVGKKDTGYPCIIKLSELNEYLNNGWYEPHYNKNNVLITHVTSIINYEFSTVKNAYIKVRVQNNRKENVYIEPRDITVNGVTYSGAYCSPAKVLAGTTQEVKIKLDNMNVSKFLLKIGFNFKLKTSNGKLNERASNDGGWIVSF